MVSIPLVDFAVEYIAPQMSCDRIQTTNCQFSSETTYVSYFQNGSRKVEDGEFHPARALRSGIHLLLRHCRIYDDIRRQQSHAGRPLNPTEP